MATVEVLLKEDVEHLGRRGDIVRVKAGYARNYLLPQNLAMLATASNVKAIEQERQALQRREAREREAAKTVAEQLREMHLRFQRKVSEQGVFYGSVTVQDIAQALAQHGVNIERRRIHLEAPIKEPGSYVATVKLHRDVVIELPITAEAEGQPERADESGATAPDAEEPSSAESSTEELESSESE